MSVPTLVYYTADVAYISVEHGRYLAEHIPDAILIEAPGLSLYLPDETDRLSAWAGARRGRGHALTGEATPLHVFLDELNLIPSVFAGGETLRTFLTNPVTDPDGVVDHVDSWSGTPA